MSLIYYKEWVDNKVTSFRLTNMLRDLARESMLDWAVDLLWDKYDDRYGISTIKIPPYDISVIRKESIKMFIRLCESYGVKYTMKFENDTLTYKIKVRK